MTASELTMDGFSGAMLRPGDADYDQARRVWNGAIDRQPALIARPESCQLISDLLAVAG